MKNRLTKFALCLVVVLALIPAPAGAHAQLKLARYECWLSQIDMYSNFDLKLSSGGRYTWMYSDGTDKKFGDWERGQGQKIRFTSGILERREFKGLHYQYDPSYGHTHVIYLFKGGWEKEDEKYNCVNG